MSSMTVAAVGAGSFVAGPGLLCPRAVMKRESIPPMTGRSRLSESGALLDPPGHACIIRSAAAPPSALRAERQAQRAAAFLCEGYRQPNSRLAARPYAVALDTPWTVLLLFALHFLSSLFVRSISKNYEVHLMSLCSDIGLHTRRVHIQANTRHVSALSLTARCPFRTPRGRAFAPRRPRRTF